MKFVKVMFLHLSVSHSVHRGEYLGRYTPGQIHPQAGAPRPGTPPGPGMPPWQVHPGTRYSPTGTPGTRYIPWEGNPLDRYSPAGILPLGPGTPPRTRYPPGPGTPCVQCRLGDMGNKWAVRILLECILF